MSIPQRTACYQVTSLKAGLRFIRNMCSFLGKLTISFFGSRISTRICLSHSYFYSSFIFSILLFPSLLVCSDPSTTNIFVLLLSTVFKFLLLLLLLYFVCYVLAFLTCSCFYELSRDKTAGEFPSFWEANLVELYYYLAISAVFIDWLIYCRR